MIFFFHWKTEYVNMTWLGLKPFTPQAPKIPVNVPNKTNFSEVSQLLATVCRSDFICLPDSIGAQIVHVFWHAIHSRFVKPIQKICCTVTAFYQVKSGRHSQRSRHVDQILYNRMSKYTYESRSDTVGTLPRPQASLLIVWWCAWRGILSTTPRAPCLPALNRRLGTRQVGPTNRSM